MRWEAKAAIQATLSRVPFGRAIHRKLQDIGSTAHLSPDIYYSRHRKFLKRLQAHGLAVEHRSFLEIGTGWHPMLPLLLRLLGAGPVLTVDLNRWLTRASFEETLSVLESLAEQIETDFDVRAEFSRPLIEHLRARCTDRSVTMQHVLREAGIEYRSPSNASNIALPDGSLDYIVSTNVLEHVTPAGIRAILAESKRVLKPGGYVLHHVDPGDHFSYDKRITTINFLQFSPRTWYYIGGSGVAYHNRLRCVDYVRLVEQSGLELIDQTTEVDPRALAEIELGRIRPHKSFHGYTAEELCQRTIEVVARSPL